MNTIAMHKHFLNWKTVRDVNIRGSEINNTFPDAVALAYRGTLLSSILQMRKKQSISFEDAIRMASKDWIKAVLSGDYNRHKWLKKNFVTWIADQGYHIEISGEEFEPAQMPSRVC